MLCIVATAKLAARRHSLANVRLSFWSQDRPRRIIPQPNQAGKGEGKVEKRAEDPSWQPIALKRQIDQAETHRSVQHFDLVPDILRLMVSHN